MDSSPQPFASNEALECGLHTELLNNFIMTPIENILAFIALSLTFNLMYCIVFIVINIPIYKKQSKEESATSKAEYENDYELEKGLGKIRNEKFFNYYEINFNELVDVKEVFKPKATFTHNNIITGEIKN